jgi:hypothetical protein
LARDGDEQRTDHSHLDHPQLLLQLALAALV